LLWQICGFPRQGWERYEAKGKPCFSGGGEAPSFDEETYLPTFRKNRLARAEFERTARPAPRERRRVRKRSVVLKQPPLRERERRGALKNVTTKNRQFCQVKIKGIIFEVYDV